MSNGGWISREGVKSFNLYRPPMIELGDAKLADPWLDQVHRVFGEDAAHIINMSHTACSGLRRRSTNALVLGGNQGIGKDTLLEPVKQAVELPEPAGSFVCDVLSGRRRGRGFLFPLSLFLGHHDLVPLRRRDLEFFDRGLDRIIIVFSLDDTEILVFLTKLYTPTVHASFPGARHKRDRQRVTPDHWGARSASHKANAEFKNGVLAVTLPKTHGSACAGEED